MREWSSGLAREWMELESDGAGTLYIDGHVRVYHGGLTKLPARYVARQKLCMRGTTDYWVNAMDGAPFFAVSQSADPGLLQTLENEILPRLLEDVPNQPAEEELAADPWRERFTLIFDRAGSMTPPSSTSAPNSTLPKPHFRELPYGCFSSP